MRRKNWFQVYLGWMIAGFLLAIVIVSCTQSGPSSPSANQPGATSGLNVVSTSTIIADWTKTVAGDQVNHTSILQPGADPHVYEPTPGDTRTFEQANLILYNGYNLEPGLIRLMESSGGKAKKVAVGEVIQPLQLDKEGAGRVPDPHVWGNVENAIAIVNRIRDELVQLVPDGKNTFTQNAAQFTTELAQLHQWIGQQIQTIPPEQRQLITTHDAFQYYARAYGLKVAGTLIGISTEEQPSAQTVKQLVEAIKATGTPAIFAETTINPTLIETVSKSAGVKLAPQKLYSDSIGAPGSDGDSYIKMMVANTTAITQNLGGRVTPFQPNASGK
ncbi:MAG: metal ABC transporter substrate-binding protein [Leptolyngbyaceae cyanobacterium bins.349]|nr:metal ABC transporter substrate-binding protein [Leptolyngbyaceae cyanobacterium bins.349]